VRSSIEHGLRLWLLPTTHIWFGRSGTSGMPKFDVVVGEKNSMLSVKWVVDILMGCDWWEAEYQKQGGRISR